MFNNCILQLELTGIVMHPWPSCNGRTRNAMSLSMSLEEEEY